jgi:general secretion pathway protein D
MIQKTSKHQKRGAILMTMVVVGLLLGGGLWPSVGLAQEGPAGTETDPQRAPVIAGSKEITLNGEYTIRALVKYFAEVLEHNYILEGGERSLNEEVSIISHKPVSPRVAEQAFISALEVAGYTLVDVSGSKQIIKTSEAAQNPVLIGEGEDYPAYDARYVTQILQLENVQVSEVSTVVSALASSNAKVIAYPPTNTLILTDTVPNLRKVQRVLTMLDVAAPKSRLEIIRIQFATAQEIAQLIEQLYGVAATAQAEPDPRSRARSRAARRRAARDEPEPSESVVAGKQASYISKVIADERTNSLIVLANEEGFQAIYELLAEVDVDVDLSSRSQIHVVYLQHAKAEEVASVLANLSESGSSQQQRTPARSTRQTAATRTTAAARARARTEAAEEAESGTGVIAAFDSGMRITSDESTNSLVIIASPEDFRVVKSVLDQLDIRRKQVYVDAVILEIGGENIDEVGVAYHGPLDVGENGVGFLGSQLGASSLGLTQDLLSGLAVGVFGESIEVPFTTAAGTSNVSVPGFGIVISALRSNSMVSIVSSPNILTLDNTEAKIVVGREIPFPTSSGLNSLGQPVVSYQREDVATELTITPRINSSNEVTLEVTATVSEIEEDSQGLDVNQAGFITSKREIETTALVRDNQTMVLGGLVGVTDTEVETKVPILGDLPLLGGLFRGSRTIARRANLMIFLTPHIIETEADMLEVMRVKQAQREEFIRRFYGRSIEEQTEEISKLLSYSMNNIDQPSMYRGPVSLDDADIGGEPMSDETRLALEEAVEESRGTAPGEGAGTLEPEEEGPVLVIPEDELPEDLPEPPEEQ